MIYRFKTRYLRISPRKMRFLIPQVKGRNANEAIEILELKREKSAKLIFKSLKSSIDAAKTKNAVEDDLKIANIYVEEGPRLKRRLIKSRGRADLIQKKMSHLIIILKDKKRKKRKKKSTKI